MKVGEGTTMKPDISLATKTGHFNLLRTPKSCAKRCAKKVQRGILSGEGYFNGTLRRNSDYGHYSPNVVLAAIAIDRLESARKLRTVDLSKREVLFTPVPAAPS